MHQCHISFLYVTFKLTAYVFFFFSTISYFISGLLWINMKPVRKKVVDSLDSLRSFQFLPPFQSSGAPIRPPHFQCVHVCVGNMGQKTAYPYIQLGFRHLDFEKVPDLAQFWNSFDKMEVYTLLGVHSKLQARGKYTTKIEIIDLGWPQQRLKLSK